MTSPWTSAHVAAIDMDKAAIVPAFADTPRPSGGADFYYWDMWPVQNPDGTIASIDGRARWMALTAPDRGDPAARHFAARIRWLEQVDGGWIDQGAVLPSVDVPYEREWAGSALLMDGRVTLFFTGAGSATRSGGYQQKLYEAHAPVQADGSIGAWSVPALSIREITADYCPADAHEGEPGRIKAFRDPAFFRDPSDGADYLVFTASLAATTSDYNGAVGLARRTPDGWVLLPPVVHADGVNNELERAHIIARDGRYYLFWVTQRSTFSPDVAAGPTGLYGMVADRMTGPWRPLNGSGLVIANPDADPFRSYSWFVSAEGITASFVDAPGDNGFVGVPAPLLQLVFEGDSVRLGEAVLA